MSLYKHHLTGQLEGCEPDLLTQEAQVLNAAGWSPGRKQAQWLSAGSQLVILEEALEKRMLPKL